MTAVQYKDNSGYGIGTWAMPRPRVVEVIIVTSMANMASRAYTNVARHDVTEASSAEFEIFPSNFFFFNFLQLLWHATGPRLSVFHRKHPSNFRVVGRFLNVERSRTGTCSKHAH